MEAIEAAFQQAVEKAQNSTEQDNKPVSNDTKLKLYAFYKQATIGDVQGSKPNMLDMVGRAKYKAWSGLKGMCKEEAMAKYVEVFEGVV